MRTKAAGHGIRQKHGRLLCWEAGLWIVAMRLPGALKHSHDTRKSSSSRRGFKASGSCFFSPRTERSTASSTAKYMAISILKIHQQMLGSKTKQLYACNSYWAAQHVNQPHPNSKKHRIQIHKSQCQGSVVFCFRPQA